MRSLEPLAPTEWLLMRAVWDLGAANPAQVADSLKGYDRDLSPSSVGILLSRLVAKGYLRSTPSLVRIVGRGRPSHVYTPLVSFEPVLRAQVERFLNDYKLDAETAAEVLESFLAQPEKRHPKKSG